MASSKKLAAGPKVADVQFKFFRSVPGRVVPRYGTDAYVGCVRRKGGFEHTEAVARIPLSEYLRFKREYDAALHAGDMTEVDSDLVDGAEST